MTKYEDAPTLADKVLRFTFSEDMRFLDPQGVIRNTLLRARRFVLDASMSTFMTDLAYSVFHQNPKIVVQRLESLRMLARTPHATTWIEYDMHARIRRRSLYSVQLPEDPSDASEQCGWLIETHPRLDTVFRATPFESHTYDRAGRISKPGFWPLAYAWCSDNSPQLFKPIYTQGDHSQFGVTTEDEAKIFTGLQSYTNPNVRAVFGPLEEHINKQMIEVLAHTFRTSIAELSSDLRYLWALLACINDIPVRTSTVTASKGFVARGRYRRFLDHTTITLTVPEPKYRKLAQRLVGAAARRRAHQVRGFWRTLTREGSCQEGQHYWVTTEDGKHVACTNCKSFRVWVVEHQRGDASLGFVTHDYNVTHGDNDHDKDKN